MKRVLITGSSGFIGSHLINLLADEGYESLGVDVRLPKEGVKPGWLFSECDLMESEKLCKIVAEFGPDIVVHLAARTDIDGRDVSDYALNFEGTRNLIDAISASGSVRRVLFASSQLVCRVGHIPRGDEDYSPVNAYAESKVLMERTVRRSTRDNVTWCLLRPTTIWGEGMSAHYQRFLKLLQAGRYFHLGNGPLYKSYGYVGNATFQISKFMSADRSLIDKKTFYIGDYQPLSLTAWTNGLARALGAREPPSVPISIARYLGLIGDAINWLGFDKFPLNSYRVRNITTEYVFDLTATEKICGTLPFTVEEGISQMAGWFKEVNAANTA